ncbi:DUF6584 family protein [Luteipulveratus mongoliensis]|uniref:DUF6584 family protein n=1 Tax=Luteipulveratus mongoliensis TaxID=571913 RepID=UPI000695FCD6|nr:DUF6584 family protein [Luteipulveratus mongoliensis]
MAVEDTLARAAADVARGDVGLARRRLSSLRVAYPTDFTVRRALRDACRAGHDLAEAGRWGYVLEDATPEEIRAFELSRGGHAREIVRAASWSLNADTEGSVSADRLGRLREEFRELPKSVQREVEGHAADEWQVALGCALIVLVIIGLLVLAIYQLVQVIASWLG